MNRSLLTNPEEARWMVRNGVNPFSSANRGRSKKDFLGIGLRTVWMFVCFALLLAPGYTQRPVSSSLFSVCLFVFLVSVCSIETGRPFLLKKQGVGSDHVPK